MVQPVAVVFVHGINTLAAGYEEPMQRALMARLPKAVRPHVTFKSVYWAERVRLRQQQYLDAVAQHGLFADNDFRRLVVQGLGDAAAYQKTKSYKNSAYFQIQADVRAVLDELDQDGLPDRPLVFIGHSLGCHIISSFAWDLNSFKQLHPAQIAAEDVDVAEFANYLRNGSPFRRLDTLAGLVMMGSNMPLFTFTFGPDRVFPITRSRGESETPAFPGPGLSGPTLDRAQWVNYYSRNDLLGFPLKPLNASYRDEPRLTDIEVASEGHWRRFWSHFYAPAAAYAAHTGYWTNRRVVKGAASLIASIATANDPAAPRRFGFGR
jgi:pimeloyl-ACP methyl ester carboxylesterase